MTDPPAAPVAVADAPVQPWRVRLPLRGDERPAILTREVLLVLGLTLGYSAVRSVMSIIELLTRVPVLSQATVPLNVSPAPGRPLLGLFIELRVFLFVYLVPALLALYLLNRDREWSATPKFGPRLGLDTRQPLKDVLSGVVLALVIGVPGLALYFAARELGINTNVAAANLTEWWAAPVLVLIAFGNGLLEEVIVVGYLVTRLRQTGWGVAAAVTFSSVLRGTYHLYQGFGAFLGNAIMGVVFALFFLRTKRLWPLILAHTALDVVAYLGYTLLRDRVPWL